MLDKWQKPSTKLHETTLNKKRGAWCAPFHCDVVTLKIPGAIPVTTVTVKLDGVASSFAGCAAKFAVV